MPQRHRPTGRALVLGATAVALVVGTTACSTVDKAQSAAIVNGSPIYTDDLATTTSQFNAYLTKVAAAQASQGGGQAQKITERDMLGYLVRSRFVVPYIDRTKAWKPDANFAQVLALLPGATQTTKDFLVTAYTEGNQVIPAAGVTQIDADIAKADIQVNPRYGTFSATPDPTTGSSLVAPVPNWIKPSAPAGPEPAATTP